MANQFTSKDRSRLLGESIYANKREELFDVYSDTYKSAHGMRPRGVYPEDYTEEELEAMIEQLYADMESGSVYESKISNRAGANKMRVTRSKLRNMIAEEIQGRRIPRLSSVLFEGEDTAKPDAAAAGSLDNLSVKSGPSEVVKFLNGPGADPRVRALLAAGTQDGDEKDEAATISEGKGTCGELVPTQVEIELTKSIGYPLAQFKMLKKMISGGVQRVGPPGNDMIVKSGNLIVDGHHRWSSLFSVAGPNGQIAAIDVALPEKDAASVLAIVQTAIAATITGKVPKAKAGGMNILGKSKEAIAAMITKAYESGEGEAGPILTDDFVSSCMSDAAVNKHFGLQDASIVGPRKEEPEAKKESRHRGSLLEKRGKFSGKYAEKDKIAAARRHIINVVADNLSQMNQPAAGSPPRVDMPQLDKAGGGVKGALEKLGAGDVNYKAPFAESRRRNDDQVVLERWQKLAGLIKG